MKAERDRLEAAKSGAPLAERNFGAMLARSGSEPNGAGRMAGPVDRSTDELRDPRPNPQRRRTRVSAVSSGNLAGVAMALVAGRVDVVVSIVRLRCLQAEPWAVGAVEAAPALAFQTQHLLLFVTAPPRHLSCATRSAPGVKPKIIRGRSQKSSLGLVCENQRKSGNSRKKAGGRGDG